MDTKGINMGKSYAPRMHSAEHLLNQVMVRKFHCARCFSAHVNKKKSKCDYHFPRPLLDEEVRAIEAEVNQAISTHLEVSEEILDVKEAAQSFQLSRLPDAVTTVRVVHIGDFDVCPCIGEHVANTSEIGQFRIVSHDWNDGVLRIRYKLEESR